MLNVDVGAPIGNGSWNLTAPFWDRRYFELHSMLSRAKKTTPGYRKVIIYVIGLCHNFPVDVVLYVTSSK